MTTISIIHGPNLNLLGAREPNHYGLSTLHDINANLISSGNELGFEILTFQSNSESELINHLQQTTADFLIFNPAAFTHTSIALRDTLLAVHIPFVEVHLSNIFKREPFRHHSYFSDIAIGVISGLGAESYSLALRYAHHYFQLRSKEPIQPWICEKLEN